MGGGNKTTKCQKSDDLWKVVPDKAEHIQGIFVSIHDDVHPTRRIIQNNHWSIFLQLKENTIRVDMERPSGVPAGELPKGRLVFSEHEKTGREGSHRNFPYSMARPNVTLQEIHDCIFYGQILNNYYYDKDGHGSRWWCLRVMCAFQAQNFLAPVRTAMEDLWQAMKWSRNPYWPPYWPHEKGWEVTGIPKKGTFPKALNINDNYTEDDTPYSLTKRSWENGNAKTSEQGVAGLPQNLAVEEGTNFNNGYLGKDNYDCSPPVPFRTRSIPKALI